VKSWGEKTSLAPIQLRGLQQSGGDEKRVAQGGHRESGLGQEGGVLRKKKGLRLNYGMKGRSAVHKEGGRKRRGAFSQEKTRDEKKESLDACFCPKKEADTRQRREPARSARRGNVRRKVQRLVKGGKDRM